MEKNRNYNDLFLLFIENYLTPQVGFEPTTNRLTVDRSATELLRIALTAINNNSECFNNWQVF